MCLRITEIGEDAVAHVFGDKAAEPGQHLGDAAPIQAEHLAQILGVEPRRQFGRTDDVAEEDCHWPPLGRGRAAGLDRSRRHGDYRRRLRAGR